MLGFGCALFIYLLVRLDVKEVSSLLLRVGWYFGLIAAIFAAHQVITALAFWKCVIGNEHTSYWDMVRIRFSAEAIEFLTFTGPFLAEPAKVWFLPRRGLRAKPAVAATVSEYLFYAFASAVLAMAGLTYLLSKFELSRPAVVAARITVYAGALLLAAAYAIGCRMYLIGSIVRGISRLPLIGKYLRLDETDVRDTEDLLFAVLRDRPLRFLSILAVEFVGQGILVLEMFLLLRTTGQLYSLLDPFLIEAARSSLASPFSSFQARWAQSRALTRSFSRRLVYLRPPASLSP